MSLDNLHRDKICFLVFAELQLSLLYAHTLLLGLWRCALFIVEQIGVVVGSVAVVAVNSNIRVSGVDRLYRVNGIGCNIRFHNIIRFWSYTIGRCFASLGC